MRTRSLLPYLAMASIFVIIDALALLFVNFLKPSNIPSDIIPYEDPNNPSNILPLLLTMFGFTAVILLLKKYRKRSLRMLSNVFLLAVEIVLFQFFYIICMLLLLPAVWGIIVSAIAELAITVLLFKHPEWYVIDAVGIMMAVYTSALMGISIGVSVVILLLTLLAVYDAIAVYRTKHMIALAGLVVKFKAPLVLFIPKVRGFSLIKEAIDLDKGIAAEGKERKVFLMGLGDFIFPSVLATSSFYFIAGQGLLVAFSVLLGTLLGYVLLMALVAKGKPQAGLPFLNSGAIFGYLVSTYILFGRFMIGG